MSQDDESTVNASGIVKLVLTGFAIVAICIVAVAAGCPSYKVYKAEMDGKAELAQADQNRQIAVAQAKAKAEAAHFEAAAEITRAGGVAQANKIIGDSLKGNEDYLHYLFINNLDHTQNQVIYIPTEAALPILEAGRRHAAPAVPAPTGK